MQKAKKFKLPAVFTILLLLIIFIGILTQFIPGLHKATLANIITAPIEGFKSAMDVSLFVLVLGGFLGVINKTNALNNGIAVVVQKLNGKEILIIPILMFLISLGGTTYGMAEETIAFYALITIALTAAGFDAITAAATILLGSTCGVMGATIDPFAVSVSLDALKAVGIDTNPAIIIFANGLTWLITYTISAIWLMRYAKKVKQDKSKSVLTEEEQIEVEKQYGSLNKNNEKIDFTKKQKLVLLLFGLTFLIMIISVIPWKTFNITIFDSWSSFLTGNSFGKWWFSDLTSLFLWMSILIGIIYRLKDTEIITSFITGASDMLGVALVISVSRGISIIMAATQLDSLILREASTLLSGTAGPVFTTLTYLVYMFLAFLIPSTSGLSTLSMPIFGPLATGLGLPPEIVVCCLSGATASINAISPTSGVTMGGIAISRINYATWFKFIIKLIPILIIVHMIILGCATLIL